MATATKQDDDLLIIADEESSSDSSGDIEFSFDFGEDTSTKESTTVSSGTTSDTAELKTEDTLESMPEVSIVEETPLSETASISEVDLTSDVDTPEISLGMDDAATETPVVDTKPVENSVNEDFSFDLSESNIDTEVVSTSIEETTNNWKESILAEESVLVQETPKEVEVSIDASSEASMNDILSATIAKLAARQELIATSKAGKSTKEEEIKAQIKELQSQVSELEAEMKELDKESDKITANITELENMKLDPVKEHNSKRVTKK